jgi:hypothetical protein
LWVVSGQKREEPERPREGTPSAAETLIALFDNDGYLRHSEPPQMKGKRANRIIAGNPHISNVPFQDLRKDLK